MNIKPFNPTESIRCSGLFDVANDSDQSLNDRVSNIRSSSTNFSAMDRPSNIPDEGKISVVEKMFKYN